MADDWAGGATIGGLAIPSEPDMVRLRADRQAKIQAQLEAQDIDGLVLLGSAGVTYATGAESPGEDSGRAGLFRPVAIVARGESQPHLYTAYWDGVPSELPSDHVHGPLFPDLDDGISEFAEALHRHVALGARLGVDEQTHPMLRALDDYEWSDASNVLGAAKIIKTADELSAIRAAQRITEGAMDSRLRGAAARRAPDRPDRHLPPCRCSSWGHQQRHRPDLAGDAADPGRGAVDDRTGTWPIPTATTDRSLRTGTSSGSTRASPSRATPRTSGAPG